MKALVVYESFFGNTEQVARAIGGALEPQADVRILEADDVTPEHLVGLDLLIVGSPTRGFRPTAGVSRFLGRTPSNGLRGVKVAAFDTGISLDDMKPPILRFLARLFGYAAKPISDRLKRKGGEPAVPPQGFFVQGKEGPLKEGELERAAAWARQIISTQAPPRQ
jgi:flavodoxin I